jgi:hypothetical protein
VNFPLEVGKLRKKNGNPILSETSAVENPAGFFFEKWVGFLVWGLD